MPDSSLWTARGDATEFEPAARWAPPPWCWRPAGRPSTRWAGPTPRRAGARPSPATRGWPCPTSRPAPRGWPRWPPSGPRWAAGEDADNAVVQAVLAARRAPALSAADALAAGQRGRRRRAPGAGERAGGLRRSTRPPGLLPGRGLPRRGLPVAGLPGAPRRRVVRGQRRGRRRRGAGADLRRGAHRRAGGRLPRRRRRGARRTPARRTGIREEAPAALELDPAAVQALLARLSSLAAPSRILAVFDVSKSMEAPVGDGTRATLARDAAKATLSLVPGDFALGLWVFAYQLAGRPGLGRAGAHPRAGRRGRRPHAARRHRRAARQHPRPAHPRRDGPLRHDAGRGPRGAGRTSTRPRSTASWC